MWGGVLRLWQSSQEAGQERLLGAGVSCGIRLRISRQAERKRALGPDQREKWMLATARDTQKELRGPKS